jgi:hypothetical protein
MGSLSAKNVSENFSRLGTFKGLSNSLKWVLLCHVIACVLTRLPELLNGIVW